MSSSFSLSLRPTRADVGFRASPPFFAEAELAYSATNFFRRPASSLRFSWLL